MNYFILLFLFSPFALADSTEKVLAGYDPKTDIISNNYEAGPYLIYDCKEQHWTCVLESYYKDCQEKRQRDLASEDISHSCAPIGYFPTKKSCFERQLFLSTHDYGKRFCLKEKWKEKNLD